MDYRRLDSNPKCGCFNLYNLEDDDDGDGNDEKMLQTALGNASKLSRHMNMHILHLNQQINSDKKKAKVRLAKGDKVHAKGLMTQALNKEKIRVRKIKMQTNLNVMIGQMKETNCYSDFINTTKENTHVMELVMDENCDVGEVMNAWYKQIQDKKDDEIIVLPDAPTTKFKEPAIEKTKYNTKSKKTMIKA